MEQVTVSPARVEFATMNWGAIVAGFTVTIGMVVILHLGGAALGLSMMHSSTVDDTGRTIGLGLSLGMVLSWAGALFVGGLFTSWFDGKNDTMMGAMHGVSVWGLTITLAVLVLALAGIHRHHGMDRDAHGSGMMQGAMMQGAVAADAAVLHAQLVRAVRQEGDRAPDMATPADGSEPSPSSLHGHMRGEGLFPVESTLIRGDKADAMTLMSAQTGLSDVQAGRVIAHVTPQADKTREDAKLSAAKAAHYAAAMAAIAFLSALFGMLTALLGGWVGANHVHKVYHLRTYTRVE